MKDGSCCCPHFTDKETEDQGSPKLSLSLDSGTKADLLGINCVALDKLLNLSELPFPQSIDDQLKSKSRSLQ